MAQKAYSLSHTKWMCKYHIVFTPKYRRKVIYNQIRSDIGEILRKLCEYVSVNIIFTISTNAFSPIAPTRIRRIRQRGCAAFGA